MSDSATIIRDDADSHRMQMSRRDWMLLWGPGFAEGPAFVSAFGLFEGFTVAHGIPKGARIERSGRILHVAGSALLAGIKSDLELLRYDYSYKIAEEPRRYGGGQSIVVGGRSGILSLRPKGYCSIQLDSSVNQPATAEVLDLRAMDAMATGAGRLRMVGLFIPIYPWMRQRRAMDAGPVPHSSARRHAADHRSQARGC